MSYPEPMVTISLKEYENLKKEIRDLKDTDNKTEAGMAKTVIAEMLNSFKRGNADYHESLKRNNLYLRINPTPRGMYLAGEDIIIDKINQDA